MTEDLQYIENALRELAFYVHACLTKQERERFRRQFFLVGGKNDPQLRDNEESQLNNLKNGQDLIFTKKEINSMPKKYHNLFAHDSHIVIIRLHKGGVMEARLRRDGFNISVSSKDYTILKQKFIKAFNEQANKKDNFEELPTNPDKVLFINCLNEWLSIKKRTTKDSTFAGYKQTVELYILPQFKDRTIKSFTRSELQEFIFSFVDAGKFRTAEKVHLILRCVFDLISEDYDLNSPMKKIVLPFREHKKGNALTKLEEKTLIDYCIQYSERPASSALLVLLYFGLRKSELKTITVSGEKLTCITSKLKMGRNEVPRTIPFTPVFRRVLKFVNFDDAKNANQNTLNTTLKRILPTHHLHELRYTFITRCKECGVNPEIVMLWDGHEEDKDVRSSKIDRGYTDYSMEYQLNQAKLVDYSL